MEVIGIGYHLVLSLLLHAPLLAPLSLVIGVLVMTSSARRRRSPAAWSAFAGYAALVAAYGVYGSGVSRGGFGLLEKDEGCGVGEDSVLDVEESWLPLSFRCSLDDGTVLERVPPHVMPVSAACLAVALLAGALTVAGRRHDRRRAGR